MNVDYMNEPPIHMFVYDNLFGLDGMSKKKADILEELCKNSVSSIDQLIKHET